VRARGMVTGIVDHYEVLGISSQASTEEVKRAYRSLSRQFHPDKAGPNVDEVAKEDHSRRMIALNIAYQVLMSPHERRNFDLSQDHSPQGKSNAYAQSQASTYAAHSSYAAAAAARRAASWGRPSAPRPPQPSATPSTTSASSKVSAHFSSAETGSCKAGTFVPMVSLSKPRYQSGGKYTQRARQARRMDPAQYTTHIDGRAHEFESVEEGWREEPGLCAGAPNTGTPAFNTPVGGSGSFELGMARHPTWLQRQIDIAKHWEEVNCPAELEQDKYQWKKATDIWKNIRERKSAREQMGEDQESAGL